MTKRTLRSKKTRAKARPLARVAKKSRRAPTGFSEPKTAASVLATPTEPTFTLSQIKRLFGDTYGGDFNPGLTAALCALDDVARTVRVCIEALPRGDDSPACAVGELLEQLWSRVEGATAVLNACRVPALRTDGAP
jgi:hypothetical protein